MDVEKSQPSFARANAVNCAGYRSKERARLSANGAVRGCELCLTFEQEERIDMVVMPVRCNAFPARLEDKLDRGDLLELHLDRPRPLATVDHLTLTREADDRFRR